MKKLLLSFAAALTAISLSAQTEEEFKSQYEMQVKAMGISGMGVEYIIKKWEAAYPGSADVQEAKFNYYLNASKYEKVISRDQPRFMGEAPIMTLPDKDGSTVNYFNETFYHDELFGVAMKAIDRAVELRPSELAYRFEKITALLEYEKEWPEMATDELIRLIDYNAADKPSWEARGEAVDEDYFVESIQEYCYAFFKIASNGSYESFRVVSEKMSKLYPSNTVFLSNLGSYWLVAKDSRATALKYYKKVLKINPKDYSAIKNCVLMARKEKNTKMEKQYLPLLIEVTDSPSERMSAEARLKML